MTLTDALAQSRLVQAYEHKIRELKALPLKAKDREALLVQLIKRGQPAHERQIMSIALFKRRHKHN